VRRVALLSGGFDHETLQFDNQSQFAGELRKVGETVFRQFFPPSICEILKKSEGGTLFLHVDKTLSHIPWELLHDGQVFLSDKFVIGRSVDGSYIQKEVTVSDRRLSVLIIADPTADLPMAKEEGRRLLEMFQTEISTDLADVRYISGRRISRLTLLTEMQDKDIVHFAGHTAQNEDGMVGFRLSDDRILTSVEIARIKNPPEFVFANSCSSFGSNSIENVNTMATAFLRSGVSGYIGTAWDIADSNETTEFALEFYRNIFLERPVGQSLYEARQMARKRNPNQDLTWAAYFLHGNPNRRLFRYPARRSFDASRSVLGIRRVCEDYPLPVANPYQYYIERHEQPGQCDLYLFESLKNSFLWLLALSGGLVFGLYKKLGLKGEQPNWNVAEHELAANQIHRFARRLHLINLDDYIAGLVKPLMLHRENILKMFKLIKTFEAQGFSHTVIDTDMDRLSYLITLQYLLENLFADLSILGRVELFYNRGSSWPALLFRGSQISNINLLPVDSRMTSLEQEVNEATHRVCVNIPARRLLIDLHDGFIFENGILTSALFGLSQHVDVPE